MNQESIEPMHVAVLGLGTVGSGVARILAERADQLVQRSGKQLRLKRVVVRDLAKPRDCQLPAGVVTDDLNEVLEDDDIRLVAQLIGGLEPARTIMLELLARGKDVVTANKALLAEHGAELFAAAREHGRSIAFEASVAGGVPIITNIGQCLAANQITSLRGILNGTSNFILCGMEEHQRDFAQAVSEAQQRGYAELDPTMDVNGADAAQKLAILAQLTYGVQVDWKEIPCEGIDQLHPDDLHYAQELGYRVKLLAVAQLTNGSLELHVSPTLVRAGMPLAEVRDANNAISVVGDAVGRVFFHGLGAGQMPTASAVVADLVDTAVGRTELTFRSLNLWKEREKEVPVADHKDVSGRYYLRFTVEDHPGMLSRIAGVLGEHGISIASVIQHEPREGEAPIVALVIMTHTASEGAIVSAIEQINRLEPVCPPSVKMRVLD